MDAMKIPVILIVLVFAIILPLVPLVQAADSPSLNGLQIFPKDNIWNTRVDNLPLDPKSAVYTSDLAKDSAPTPTLHHYISTAIPYNVVTSAQRHQYITSFSSPAYSDNVAYPIPTNPLYEQGSTDHHMEIIDKDEMVLYELYAVNQASDGSWHAGTGAVWDLEGNLFRKNNATPMWGTDESGLPVFPGLVRYDEVSSGQINHALRISVPALQNTWVWPARSSSPLPGVYDPLHPPAGQRFRLKSSFDISGYPPQAKVILQALKTYGAMATTNNGKGKPVSVIGSPDSRWDYTDLNSLYTVHITDFEAVDVSSLMIDRNSAQARQFIGGTATPTITVTSPNGYETWQRGTSRTVTWDYTGSPGSTVNIVLMKGSAEAGTIASSVSIGSGGHGSFVWPIYASGSTGSDYKVSIQSTSQPSINDVSNNYFTLTGSFTPTPAGQTEIGVFNREWHLDTNGNGIWDGPATDTTFSFGAPGDVPLVGDWDGNGISDIGVFRPDSGNWYLDYNPSGVVDTAFHFGTIGDIPVIGDWNGNGTSDTAVFRPSTGNWYLNYYKDGVVNEAFHFGTKGDIPVSGDWDGNGMADVGVFRPSTGNWYLATTKSGTIASAFHFGKTGDIPVTGDWNGDGSSDAGVFRPSTGNWYLATTKSGTVDSAFRFGKSGDIPVTGDWNGDGTSDAGVFRPSCGHWYLNYGTQGVVDKAFQFGSPDDIPVTGVWN